VFDDSNIDIHFFIVGKKAKRRFSNPILFFQYRVFNRLFNNPFACSLEAFFLFLYFIITNSYISPGASTIDNINNPSPINDIWKQDFIHVHIDYNSLPKQKATLQKLNLVFFT